MPKASPLLGVSQGMAIYFDGVRINESFGDVVNWDMIPINAIANMQLMPGSMPQFGLNALGGALSMQSKSGIKFNKHRILAFLGNYENYGIELESGARFGEWAYYISGKFSSEKGWRDYSLSSSNKYSKL